MNCDPARARFLILQALRWTGVAMVLAGLLIARGRIDLPAVAGYALILAGLFDTLIAPRLLARRWKSPPP